jgi:hypothetical protein
MSKRIQMAVLGAVALLAAGTVAAAEPWMYVGGEAAWTLAPQATQSATTRAGSGAAPASVQATAGIWQSVGGEAGWTAASHVYELQGGSVVHAHQAWCVASHDLPAAAKPTASEALQLQRSYGGA